MYASVLVAAALVATVAAQADQRTTPVPILRQINTHNDDGSYTYGYEAADGSYKIETKTAIGEVRGKYGYYDSDGKLREVEYGANRNGFNPSGTDIQVPPPVISTGNDDYEDDGQYRPGPDEAAYQQQQQPARQASSSRLSLGRNFNTQLPAPRRQQQQYQPQPQYQQPQQQYQQQQYQPQQYQQQQYQPQQYQQPAQPQYQPVQIPAQVFSGHPARNINLNSGSYSIQY